MDEDGDLGGELGLEVGQDVAEKDNGQGERRWNRLLSLSGRGQLKSSLSLLLLLLLIFEHKE